VHACADHVDTCSGQYFWGGGNPAACISEVDNGRGAHREERRAQRVLGRNWSWRLAAPTTVYPDNCILAYGIQ